MPVGAKVLLTEAVTHPGPRQVRSKTESPCLGRERWRSGRPFVKRALASRRHTSPLASLRRRRRRLWQQAAGRGAAEDAAGARGQ